MVSCSWDTKPNPSYNYYGTGNVEEVLPGVIKPLAADLIIAETNAWAKSAVERIGVGDIVNYQPLPSDNIFAMVGGRVAVNIAWLGAFVGSYQPEQQAEMLSQFLRGDREGMKSNVSENVERARKTRTLMEKKWDAAPAAAGKDALKAERWRKASLRPKAIAAETDGQLMERIEKTIAMCGEMFVRHGDTTMAGGELLGSLTNFLDERVPGHPPEWTTTLTSALGDVVSARPVAAIWELAQLARGLKPVAAAFTAGDMGLVRRNLASPPDEPWKAFSAAFAAFVDEYGFRGQGEIQASVPDWGEDPTFVLGSIRTHLTMKGSKDPAKDEAKAARPRLKLEAEVEKKLPAADRARYRELLERTQLFVRARELTKANLSRATRAYRPPALELGRRLAERGIIAAPDDVWFLRLTELREAVAGTLTGRVAKGRVTKRRAEYAELQGYEPPVVFTLPVELMPLSVGEHGAKTLSGVGVSPGVATGRARVILSAEAGDDATIEDGEVLVAPITDAAWTPLFWPAAAVVVERGGMLSHASTVARELGLPAVVGVANATQVIPNGAMVTVDGNTGTITVE